MKSVTTGKAINEPGDRVGVSFVFDCHTLGVLKNNKCHIIY
jgi:hypothetical protein